MAASLLIVPIVKWPEHTQGGFPLQAGASAHACADVNLSRRGPRVFARA